MEEITQLDMVLWADLACVGLNADVKFLLLGDFRQLPAVLGSWAGHSQLAGGRRHDLTENMRSDPGIFNFVKWLRVGEEACLRLEQAKARLKELYPGGRTPRWSSATASAWPSTQWRTGPWRRRPQKTQVIHIDLGETPNCNTEVPGCASSGPAEVEPDGVRLDNGVRLKTRSCCGPPGQATQ